MTNPTKAASDIMNGHYGISWFGLDLVSLHGKIDRAIRAAQQEGIEEGKSLAAEAENVKLRSFLRSFLNPEERGHAVPAHVRDDVRELLGMRRVETTGEEPKR